MFDGVVQRFYKKEAYYEFHQAEVERIYDWPQTREKLIEHETYGSWHVPKRIEEFHAQMAKRLGERG